MTNPFSLIGKTILVTGASSGIGRQVAISCSQQGASVVITGRNSERLGQSMHELDKSMSQQHQMIVADLNSDEGIEKLSTQTVLLDGAVFCSGINDKAPIKYVDREKIDKMYNTNVFGPMLLLKNLLKQKKINKEASLVYISSISSIYATISNTLYASTKGAINSMIKVLALELAPRKVRVNSIMPGMIKTGMIHAYGLSEEEMAAVIKGYPLGRIGETEDVANAAIYFLSGASSWVTGSNLVVDGGITLR